MEAVRGILVIRKIKGGFRGSVGLSALFPFFSTGGNEFYEYNYTRTIEVTQVVTTEPGVIQSGADLTINSDKLLNKDSRIRRAGC